MKLISVFKGLTGILLALSLLLLVPVVKAETVNINKADAATLQYLPGVGPVRAKAIVDYRKKNGSFKSVNDLKNVKGVGDGVIGKLKSKASTSKGVSSLSPEMKKEMGSRSKASSKSRKQAVEKKSKKEVSKSSAKSSTSQAKKKVSSSKSKAKKSSSKAKSSTKKASSKSKN